jgi:transcriptional regulator with XRE-family HTH domain
MGDLLAPLRVARRNATLTQAHLARRARVSRTTIQNLESGQVPTHAVAKRVARALDVEPEALWSSIGYSRPRSDDSLARRLRLDRGLTQAQVAKGAGLSPSVIHKADAGKPLSLATVAALAAFYDVPADAIQAPATDLPLNGEAGA